MNDQETAADLLPEQVHAFRKKFKELLDAADIDQLIVDDHDPCLPKRVIAIFEAIRSITSTHWCSSVTALLECEASQAGPLPLARSLLDDLLQAQCRFCSTISM